MLGNTHCNLGKFLLSSPALARFSARLESYVRSCCIPPASDCWCFLLGTERKHNDNVLLLDSQLISCYCILPCTLFLWDLLNTACVPSSRSTWGYRKLVWDQSIDTLEEAKKLLFFRSCINISGLLFLISCPFTKLCRSILEGRKESSDSGSLFLFAAVHSWENT